MQTLRDSFRPTFRPFDAQETNCGLPPCAQLKIRLPNRIRLLQAIPVFKSNYLLRFLSDHLLTRFVGYAYRVKIEPYDLYFLVGRQTFLSVPLTHIQR